MMTKIAWRSVRQHPVRFAMSVLVVILGVAFVTGTFSLRAVMSSTFSDIVDNGYAAQAYVRGVENPDANSSTGIGTDPTAGRFNVPIDLSDDIAAVDGVKEAIPDVNGSLVLTKADGTALASNQAPTIAFGIVESDPSFTLKAGELPDTSDELALETKTLERAGLSVGDTTTAVLAGRPTPVRIVGEFGFAAATSGASLIGLDLDTALQLFAPDGNISTIAVYAQPGVSEEQLVANLVTAIDEPNVDIATGSSVREDLTAQIDSMLGFMSTFLLIFAAVALVVGGFIIANTFTMVVRQRLREIAVLRAVGASPRQVFGSVVGQAAIVGLIGSILGVAGGIGLVSLLRTLMASLGMELSTAIPLDAQTALIGILTGVGVCVISAAIPARQASKVPPVDAMRETVTMKDKQLKWRGILGGILVIGGAVSLVGAIAQKADGGGLLAIGAIGLLVGMLVWAPAVTRPVLRFAAWPLVKWGRPVGPVAVGNVVRNPRRTASTSGALMIGMALIGAAAVLATSAQATLKGLVDTSLKADFVLQSVDQENGVPSQAVAEIKDLADVAQVDTGWFTVGRLDGTTNLIGGIEPRALTSTLEAETISGNIDEMNDDTILVQEYVAKQNGWQAGDEVTIDLTDTDGTTRSSTMTIAAVIKLDLVGVPVFTTEQWYLDNVPQVQQSIAIVLVKAQAGADLDDVRSQMAQIVKPYLVITIMDHEEFNTDISNQVNQILLILYALLALSIVIAVLGIVNTLALSIAERTREIGLLRAVGMSKLQLTGVVVAESMMIALFGAIGGLAVGVSIASALPAVFQESGFDQLAIPWAQLGSMVVIAAIVGLVAALWPALRASRLPVLDALAYE